MPRLFLRRLLATFVGVTIAATCSVHANLHHSSSTALLPTDTFKPTPPPQLIVKTVDDYSYVPNPLTGQLDERVSSRKQLYQVVMKKTLVPDPSDPEQMRVVEVPQEVEYTPNKEAKLKLSKLKDRFKKLKRRERQLQREYQKVKVEKQDHPVLEDGAPAPPDAQEAEAREALYNELGATKLGKAPNIKQSDLDAARAYDREAGSVHSAFWDFAWKMKEKKLVPESGWVVQD